MQTQSPPVEQKHNQPTKQLLIDFYKLKALLHSIKDDLASLINATDEQKEAVGKTIDSIFVEVDPSRIVIPKR